ncbi:hypothetical protein O7623_23640 [Solwaraspora sp. WMMD791]|uniref:hypothetical protein n=1 Tax=Solwaraspora sp. WMMD791 TaxID=3016086 RepID=UPI00249B41E3|nr:hypothetical protein [Solwaraspora sp. WMMD791]WFE26306.1 hypothetical protein O7623_23640 [Solwaraspora sp. WMMD791]
MRPIRPLLQCGAVAGVFVTDPVSGYPLATGVLFAAGFLPAGIGFARALAVTPPGATTSPTVTSTPTGRTFSRYSSEE